MSYNIKNDDVLQYYLKQIKSFDALTFEKEQELAKRWRDEKDYDAFHELMQSYLRLVVKVAIGFRGYGLPTSEVIQEGNLGLMQAISKFDPDRGFRLSTYAMWWIRASIQEYVLNNWSVVKIGTTSSQKKLFFNLRRLRNKLREAGEEHTSPEAITAIATELGVNEQDVEIMDQRLSNDQSLNATISNESESGEWQDWLVEERPNQEEAYSNVEQAKLRRKQLGDALNQLDERERDIFIARQLNDSEQSPTLEDLSQHYGVSRERVRQLEARAFKKVQKFILENASAA